MVETIVNDKWHWYNVQRDLVEQGGLEDKDVMINPLTVKSGSCGGDYKKNKFLITWAKDYFLLLSTQNHDQKLVDAFAKVVGYSPFVNYKEPDSGLITTEWDKVNPTGRYQELEKMDKLDLTKLLE